MHGFGTISHRNKILSTCRRAIVSPKNLFLPDIYDIFLACFVTFITISIWLITAKRFGFDSIYTFWDAPNSLVWIQGSLDNSDDLYTIYYGTSAKDIMFPHCGYYLYMYLIYILALGSFKYTLLLSVIISGILSVYLFKRLLLVYRPVKNILFSCVIFCLIPLHTVMYRAVPTYDTFFLNVIMLALIFAKLDYHILAAITSIYVCLIRFEGVIVPITLLIVESFKRNLQAVSFYMIAIMIDLFVLILRVDWKFFIVPNQPHTVSYIDVPYNITLTQISSISNLMKGNSYLISHSLFLLGTGFLVSSSLPLAIFCIFWEIFYASLTNTEPMRFAIPLITFSIVCGFDMLFNSKNSRFILVVLAPFYMFLVLFVSSSQYQAYQDSKQIWNAFR